MAKIKRYSQPISKRAGGFTHSVAPRSLLRRVFQQPAGTFPILIRRQRLSSWKTATPDGAERILSRICGPAGTQAAAVRRIVKRTNMSRILHGLLSLIVLCVFARADIGGQAPPFTAQTLDGEILTSASLSGRVILIEFWATWCPYCRRDQSSVDNIERAYSSKGLIVLAVDVGESESAVRKYLNENPRSCRVVLNNGLASRFGAHGFPYYVVIDREGNISGTQSGSAGEASLLHLLSRAGLFSATRDAANQHPSASPSNNGAQVIEEPLAQSTLPPKPSPKTIFVFANGERLEVDHYTIHAGLLHLAVGGQQRTVALSTLDIKTTIAVNHERGIELKIPQSKS
jgi:thiol-disulfide isomerase/thioredoxin